jgi:hypothetical protein
MSLAQRLAFRLGSALGSRMAGQNHQLQQWLDDSRTQDFRQDDRDASRIGPVYNNLRPDYRPDPSAATQQLRWMRGQCSCNDPRCRYNQ